MKRIFLIIPFLTILLLIPDRVLAQSEIGHYAPGVLGLRDFTMPAPGCYGALYTYVYTTDRLNNSDGNQINSVTTNSGATINLNVNVDAVVSAPTFIWITNWKILGGNYGLFISPSFGNTSVGASLASSTGRERSANESQFGMGDLFVQPVWLGWNKEHWAFALSYGFYAPIGKYDTETVSLPLIGSETIEASDNIGLGFWTNQFQGAISWYPWKDQRMAVATGLSYEIHSKKEDFDLQPGQDFSLNWGVSEYFPLDKNQKFMMEAGPGGYSSWQVTDDSGSDALKPAIKDEVHAIGAQVGLIHVAWNASLSLHYFYEFAAKDRFQGQSFGLNFAVKF